LGKDNGESHVREYAYKTHFQTNFVTLKTRNNQNCFFSYIKVKIWRDIMKNRNAIIIPVLLLGSVLILGGCSSSSSSNGPGGGTTPVNVAGTVSAPGGTVAFNTPHVIEKFFAMFVGVPAYAAIDGVLDVGAGVTVNLIEVDAAGVQVGAVIATTTTTAGGAYSLDAPEGFIPGPQYVVRADGGGGATIEARVTSTSVDVGPVSDATSDVVTTIAAGDLSTLNNAEVDAIQDAVDNVSQDINPAGLGVDALATSLQTEVANNEASSNVINSTVADGTLCGTVTDSAAAGIANVRIVVRDFGNWVTRAKIMSATDGSYCLNVPLAGDTDPFTGNTLSGQYIVGALNRTDQTANPLKSASEWYTSGGGGRTQFDAEMVVVNGGIPTLNGIDFQLADGARIQGTMTTPGAGSAEGIKIIVRDYDTLVPVAWSRVEADGSYQVSVAAGDYLIFARNRTLLHPYATIMYNASNTGVDNNRNAAGRNTVAVTDTLQADFTLALGNMLRGQVLDAPGGNAVQGVRVRVDLSGDVDYGGTAARLRTKKDGSYRVWLKPYNSYNFRSHGQAYFDVDLTAGGVIANFTAQQGTVTGTLLDGNSNPVSHAKIQLYTVNTGSIPYVYTLISQELSNSDGSFKLYATTGAAYKLLVRIDDTQLYGALVYGDVNTIATGTDISVTTGAATALGTITLPTQDVFGGAGVLNGGAGILSGTVGNNGVTGIPGGQRIEVRLSASDNTGRFFRTRTRGDGSYVVPMPAGSYTRVRFPGAVVYFNVLIINGATTTRP
jgi:hypothetical protein